MSISTSVSKLTYQFSSLADLAEIVTMIKKFSKNNLNICFLMILLKKVFEQKEQYVDHLLLKSRACSHFVRLDLIVLIAEGES